MKKITNDEIQNMLRILSEKRKAAKLPKETKESMDDVQVLLEELLTWRGADKKVKKTK